MSDELILNDLKKAVLEGEDDLAQEIAKKGLAKGIDPLILLNQGAVLGVKEAGELWKQNEYFQTDIILCAEAFQRAMEEIEPQIPVGEKNQVGKILIGTVAGDVHDLGKMMVVASLRGGGFQVIDLGVDVPTDVFINKIKEEKPDILGLGCYMSTTMLIIEEILERLKSEGLRDSVKIIVGGVPTSQEFANEIGVDAWGKDAFDAVDKAITLMEGS